MTEILSADSPTKPKPLTKLVAHLRAHPFIIAGTLFCVAVLVFEWLTYWPDLNGFETALSTLIPVLTLGVAIMPVPFSLSIIVVEVLRGIFYIFPVVHSGPTVYYSVWLALIVIGYEMPAKYAIPITVIAALDTMVDNAIFQVPFDANDIGFAATFLLDGFAGLAIRRNKEFARLRYEQREQAKQIHLVRTLHDDIGGSLSYALLLCRNAQAETDPDTLRTSLETITQTVESTLADLRTNIITPLSASTPASTAISRNVDESTTTGSCARLCQNVLRQPALLEQAGFNGTIHVSGEATDESANLVNICLTEICNNILKHGTHSYVVRIRFGERTTLVASNEIAAGEAQPDSAHHGLEMLESRLHDLGAAMTVSEEDGLWQSNDEESEVQLASGAFQCMRGLGAKSVDR